MTPTTTSRLAKAARNVRTADNKRIFAKAKEQIDADVRAFLDRAKEWFPDGKWSADALRQSELLHAATIAANELGNRLGHIGESAVNESRKMAVRQAVRAVAMARSESGLREAEVFGEGLHCGNASKALSDLPPCAESIAGHTITIVESLSDGVTIVAQPSLLPGEPADPPYSSERRNAARVIVREQDGRIWLHDPEGEPFVMLPGGGVEDGESMQQAAVRECLEETGLIVELTGYVADMIDAFGWRRFYTARRIGGEPTTIDADDGSPVKVHLISQDEALAMLTSELDKAAVAMSGKRMVEADYDPSKHPHAPKGSPEGGQFIATDANRAMHIADGVVWPPKSPAEVEAWGRYRNDVHLKIDALMSSAQTKGNVTEEMREKYRATLHRVIDRLGGGAVARISQQLNTIVLHDSFSTVTYAYRDEFGDDGKPGITCGFWVAQRGELNIDGGSSLKRMEVYSHEIGHVIDGRRHEYSHDQEWLSAWKAEIDTSDEPLSAYARADHMEGFGEMVRLVTDPINSRDGARKAFPRCYGFLWRRGIV